MAVERNSKLIKIAEEIYDDMSRIMEVMELLNNASKAAKEILGLIVMEDCYEGRAKEDMILFYDKYRDHLNSLILLYSKSYLYGMDAVKELIKADAVIGAVLANSDKKK